MTRWRNARFAAWAVVLGFVPGVLLLAIGITAKMLPWMLIVLFALVPLLSLQIYGGRRPGFWPRHRLRIGCTIGALIWIGLVPFLLLPVEVDRIVATDGHKVLVFEQMSHVATPEFYDKILADMTVMSAPDHLLIFEGVRPAIDSSKTALVPHRLDMAAFLLRSADLYPKQAKNAGLVAQPSDAFIEAFRSNGGTVVDIDITADELHTALHGMLAPERPRQDPTPWIDPTWVPQAWRQRFYRIPINMTHVSECLRRVEIALHLKRPDVGLYGVIVDQRNTLLSRAIIAAPDPLVGVVYGAEHWPGTWAMLKRADPSWRVVESTQRYAF